LATFQDYRYNPDIRLYPTELRSRRCAGTLTTHVCATRALMATIYCTSWARKESGKRSKRRQDSVCPVRVAENPVAENPLSRATIQRAGHSTANSENVAAKFTSAKIIPGLALEKYYPALKDCLLLSFTEIKSKTAIDRQLTLIRESACSPHTLEVGNLMDLPV
jgi:hypothetical protein